MATRKGRQKPPGKLTLALVNTAKMKREKTPAKAKVHKGPIMETLSVPAALLLAAESVAAKAPKEEDRLHGVMLHQVDPGKARVIARDAGRVFIGSFPISGTAPSWLAEGLMLHREDLKARVGMLAKVEGSLIVNVSHAKGTNGAELADTDKSAVMKAATVHVGRFPPYDHLLTAASFTNMDIDGESSGRDWQAVGFSSKSLKYCGDIAKLLEQGLPKDRRPKEGMVIRAFTGSEHSLKVFDFPQWPGALLLLQPIPAGYLPIDKETQPVLAPAVKLTVAALRAHETRWRDRAEAAATDGDKAVALAKAKGFQDRVEALIARTPTVQIEAPPAAVPAIPAPEAEELPMPSGTDSKPETVH